MKNDPRFDPEGVEWSKHHFAMLAVGGTWAVPRSGLIFQKQEGNTLALIGKMPWSDEIGVASGQGVDVPKTKEAFEAFQQNDFKTIASYFEAAGIAVVDKT